MEATNFLGAQGLGFMADASGLRLVWPSIQDWELWTYRVMASSCVP